MENLEKIKISHIWNIILIIFITGSLLLIAIFNIPGLEFIKNDIFEEEVYSEAIDISPDGESVAVGSIWTGQVRIYDFDTGRQTHILPINMSGNQIILVKWSPDGEKIATMNYIEREHTLFIWSNEGQLLKKYIVSDESFSRNGGLAWSPISDEIAICSKTILTIIDIETDDKREYSFQAQTTINGYYSIDWTSDGQYIAIGCPKYLHILNTSNGTIIATIPDFVQSVAWKPGTHIVAYITIITPFDYSIKIWNFTSEGEPIVIFHTNSREALHPKIIMWSPDWNLVASVSLVTEPEGFSSGFTVIDGDNHEIKYTSFAPPQSLIQSRNGIPLPYDVSDDGKWVVTGSIDGRVLVWDLETGDYVRMLPGYNLYQLVIIGIILLILTLQFFMAIKRKFNGTLSMLSGSTIMVLSILADASDTVIRPELLFGIYVGLILYIAGLFFSLWKKEHYFKDNGHGSKLQVVGTHIFTLFLIFLIPYSIYTINQIVWVLSKNNPFWYPQYDNMLIWLVLIGMVFPTLIQILYGKKKEVLESVPRRNSKLSMFSIIIGNIVFTFLLYVVGVTDIGLYFIPVFLIAFSIIPISADLSLTTLDSEKGKSLKIWIARIYLRQLQLVSLLYGIAFAILVYYAMSLGT